MKLSKPFSCFIVLICSIPFALMSPRSGKMVGFALSILICFIFWGFISVGQALGENHFLPPFLGAWFANIIFGLFGIVFLWKARK